MSRKIKSGWCSAIFFTPSNPSEHSATKVNSGNPFKYSLTIALAKGSSSMMITLLLFEELLMLL